MLLPKRHEPIYVTADFQHDAVWTIEDVDPVSGAVTYPPVDWTGLTVTAELSYKGDVALSATSGDGALVLAANGLLALRWPQVQVANLTAGATYDLSFYVSNSAGVKELSERFAVPVMDPRK